MTPLMHAACKGRVACVNYLLGNENREKGYDGGAAASTPDDDGGGVSDLLVKVKISPEGAVTIRPNVPPLQRAVSFEDGVGGAGSETETSKADSRGPDSRGRPRHDRARARRRERPPRVLQGARRGLAGRRAGREGGEGRQG